ncbi:MAG: eL32 family ribosomal protein [Candidatus Pacearchaeota archaeon]
MKSYKFLRQNTRHFKRLGGRRKKQKWRKARGPTSKIRLGIRGKPIKPKIGFKKSKKEKTKIKRITCLKDISEVKKGESVIIAKLGKKKRRIIIEKLKEKEARILNP